MFKGDISCPTAQPTKMTCQAIVASYSVNEDEFMGTSRVADYWQVNGILSEGFVDGASTGAQ
jgi:hypothetical protein